MGKWYSHKAYVSHKNMIGYHISADTKDISHYYSWVLEQANRFPREAIAIGALTLNDLVQAGNVGLIEAWNRVDWDHLSKSDNPQGELWSFLKIRIKGAIRREIDKHAEHASRPINQMEQARKNLNFDGIEKIMINVFPRFFDDAMVMWQPDVGPWISYQLEIIIEEQLIKVEKNVDNRDILLKFYGIGYKKPRAAAVLARAYRKTEANINKIVQRTKDKLRTEEFENIIENFYKNMS